MIVDGQKVYPYVLIVANSPMQVGFDAEPIDKVQARWLKAWAHMSAVIRSSSLKTVRANLTNAYAEKMVMHDEEHERIDASEVKIATDDPISPDEASLLILNGIPSRDGYGSVRVMGDLVRGISYIDHENLSRIMHVEAARALKLDAS